MLDLFRSDTLTAIAEFTPDDYAILHRTPSAVAFAVAYAERDDAIRLMRELRAGLTAAREAAFAFPDNEIVQALAEAMQEIEDESEEGAEASENGHERPDDTEEILPERNPRLAAETSLDLARQSIEILQANATLEETVQFKHWLIAIAEQVALATRSGGVLGLGGTQLSDEEQAYLMQLREALTIDVAQVEEQPE
jgi:hypothetical protein